MKKELKTQLSKKRIVDAAILEFAITGYSSFIMNVFCEKNNISKGLFYNNFKNKNDLYCECVNICFNELLKFLKSEKRATNLNKYFRKRLEFMLKEPYMNKIITEVLINCPNEISSLILNNINELKKFNEITAEKFLLSSSLKRGITIKNAKEYISFVQNLLESYFFKINEQILLGKNLNIYDELNWINKAVNMMIYGII